MNEFPVASRILAFVPSLLALPVMAQSEPPAPVAPGKPAAAVPASVVAAAAPASAPVAPAPVLSPAAASPAVASPVIAPVAAAPQKESILTASPADRVPEGLVPRNVGWGSRYELGPGDELNFAIYGKPALSKINVPVAPDGTITYLQARQVPAQGKTIDELRVELSERLSAYHRDPMIMVTPAKLGNKTYTILGEVVKNGSYPLTRPTTLLEALALAGGFNVGSLGLDASELADLRRSFVVRNGRKLGVDLEALYLRGDFSQNISLQPNDYIHIASLVRNEIFVLGKVSAPGVYPIRNGMTAMGAVSAAGGFSQTAWRNRVLVVRGKLHQPDCHVVQLNKTMHGAAADMAVEPGDLIFVSMRPWAYPAQVLDSALRAYIDGTVAGLLAEEDGAIGFSVGPSL